MNRRVYSKTLLAALTAALGFAAEAPVIPQPVKVTAERGLFVLKADSPLVVSRDARAAGRLLETALLLRAKEGRKPPQGGVAVVVDRRIQVPSDEGYILEVTQRGAVIRGKSPAGAFYGAQTFLQFMSPGAAKGRVREIRCLRIEDYPRFQWRGAMLDPARHFIAKQNILKFIDALAMQKMNVLHLHLTDDQGWRMQIKKYPLLTEIGSQRSQTRVGHEREKKGFDGKPHGGYYTQDDLREIVAYAAERFITVVPEIEMPGHATAAIAAYPELGNTGNKIEVSAQWGIHKDVFNVEEKTIRFLQDVLEEVLSVFPSRYIHVGGDEVPLDQWKASPAAQARMKELGLKQEVELHGYFIRRMDEFLRKRGRRLIGWDEILEGGVDPSAAVMSWRGSKGGIAAARAGHDVVMAPNTYTYFDYYQAKDPKEPLAIGGFLPLERVYSFDPVPAELKMHEARRILGAQGQLWSEYIPTFEHLEYMAFPRLTALAEVAWTPKERKDYAGFLRRWRVFELRLKERGVRFRPVSD